MKYENVEFERNFQLKSSVRSANEPNSTSTNSVRSHQQSEESHDDIQVSLINHRSFIVYTG